MADITYLKEKVQKAEEKVIKCKKVIEKHQAQLEKKIQNGADEWDINYKKDDIKGATKKLEDAKRILENWKSKFAIEVEKERFLEGNAPDVIKLFLNDWKDKAFDYYTNRYEAFQDYKIKLAKEEREAREYCVKNFAEYQGYLDDQGEIEEYFRNNLRNVHPRTPMETYLKEKGLDWKSIREKEVFFAGSIVLNMCTYHKEKERLEWLEKLLEQEKKSKTLDLINRINKVVGTILDARHLEINQKGNLDGFVIGEKGKAQVETIGAGGYNIQEFHYRTLVKEIN